MSYCLILMRALMERALMEPSWLSDQTLTNFRGIIGKILNFGTYIFLSISGDFKLKQKILIQKMVLWSQLPQGHLKTAKSIWFRMSPCQFDQPQDGLQLQQQQFRIRSQSKEPVSVPPVLPPPSPVVMRYRFCYLILR